ncbi:hypothetical protein NDK47_08265 [Brevibacillus ruminantium]|uniref:Filament cap protein n=1 Tax=Brevibacillus ruminantium TaxID=2950604 RepID=A0ABY4WMB0_9BACL|nr:hypothetical protein [Brevibacillus ruminantium]USG67253.1 hypothetical protein NDK47_08265 [Brevibacillus ruminantium]
MRVTAIRQVPYSQRVGTYHFQMIQAKLNGPVQPITGYNLQPFYTRHQQWITDFADSLSNLYRYSAELNQAVKQFDPSRRNSVLYARRAISSNRDRLQAKAGARAKPGQHQIEIIRLAAQQMIEGKWADSGDTSIVPPGLHRFSLFIGEQETPFSVQVSPQDTHEQVLKQLVHLLHQSGRGVSGSLEYQGESSRLVLRSLETGAEHAFFLRDQEGSLVRTLGLDQITRQAENAEYYVDGTWQSSSSNRVELTDKVTATLLQTGRVTLRIEPDHETLLQKVRDVIDRYNRLHAFLRDRPDLFVSHMSGTLERVSQAIHTGLGDFGLYPAADGQLAVDEEVLLHSLERNYPAFEKEISMLPRLLTKETGVWNTTSPSLLTYFSNASAVERPFSSIRLPHLFFRQAIYTGLIVNQLW